MSCETELGYSSTYRDARDLSGSMTMELRCDSIYVRNLIVTFRQDEQYIQVSCQIRSRQEKERYVLGNLFALILLVVVKTIEQKISIALFILMSLIFLFPRFQFFDYFCINPIDIAPFLFASREKKIFPVSGHKRLTSIHPQIYFFWVIPYSGCLREK
jgi:hypothetical protein